MALRLLDATAIINRTTNLVQGNSDGCFQFWFMTTAVSTSPDYLTAWAQINAGYTAWNGIFSNASVSAGEMQISADNGGGASGSANFVVPANTPVNFGYRRFGTTHQFLCNGFIVGTVTEDMSAVTFIEQVLGYDGFSVIPGTLLFWDYGEWTTSKSVGHIQGQMASFGVPYDASFLNCFTPLASDLLDDSGNGNDWSGAGNFDFVANPSLPQNVSPATATVITSLPFTETIGETYNLPLWYKRTPVAPESYIGGWGFGGLGSYEPAALVWSGDGTQEWPIDSAWQTVSINKPFQTPVVPGDDFYFEFRSQFGGGGGQLDVSFLPEPTETVPTGAILVTNEWPGYSASINSVDDGHVYQFKYPGFPSSEFGAGLSGGNGRILVSALDNFYDSDNLFLYEPDLSLVLTVPWATDEATAITSNLVDTFYIAYEIPGVVENYVLRMDADGNIDPTVIGPLPGTTVTGFTSIAVSPDETILYYRVAGNNLGAIHAWDIVNNVALPDLVASPGVNWFGMGTLLTMPNGDIIGGFGQFLSGTQEYIARYAPDGTELWQYDTSPLQIDYHGAKTIAGPGFPDEILLIASLSGGHSIFITLDADTGAEISSFQVAQYELGVYAPAETATPEARFGPAPSCFYYSLPAGSGPAPICPGLMGAPRIGL